MRLERLGRDSFPLTLTWRVDAEVRADDTDALSVLTSISEFAVRVGKEFVRLGLKKVRGCSLGFVVRADARAHAGDACALPTLDLS